MCHQNSSTVLCDMFLRVTQTDASCACECNCETGGHIIQNKTDQTADTKNNRQSQTNSKSFILNSESESSIKNVTLRIVLTLFAHVLLIENCCTATYASPFLNSKTLISQTEFIGNTLSKHIQPNLATRLTDISSLHNNEQLRFQKLPDDVQNDIKRNGEIAKNVYYYTDYKIVPEKVNQFLPVAPYCPETGRTVCKDTGSYPMQNILNLIVEAKTNKFNFSSLFVNESENDEIPHLKELEDELAVPCDKVSAEFEPEYGRRDYVKPNTYSKQTYLNQQGTINGAPQDKNIVQKQWPSSIINADLGRQILQERKQKPNPAQFRLLNKKLPVAQSKIVQAPEDQRTEQLREETFLKSIKNQFQQEIKPIERKHFRQSNTVTMIPFFSYVAQMPKSGTFNNEQTVFESFQSNRKLTPKRYPFNTWLPITTYADTQIKSAQKPRRQSCFQSITTEKRSSDPNSNNQFYTEQILVDRNDIAVEKQSVRSRRQSNFNEEPEEFCKSRQLFITPKAALNDKSEWRYIVNLPEKDKRLTQIIKVDVCATANGPCSNQIALPFGYVGKCKQKYIKKKLLALDPDGGGTSTENFFVPSCCVCQITRTS